MISTQTSKVTSKRKIPPKGDLLNNLSLRQRFQRLQKLYEDCWLQKNDISGNSELGLQNLWILHQYFVPDCNGLFYDQKPFQILLKYLNFTQHPTCILPYRKYKQIKKALPTPKLFYQGLFYRKNKRQSKVTRRGKVYQRNPSFTNSTQLKAGQKAWAVHPVCKHIHLGQIYAKYHDDMFFVKFANPHLGTFRVPEKQITTRLIQEQDFFFPLKNLSINLKELTENNESYMVSNRNRLKGLQIEQFCCFTDLLQLKYQFLAKLQQYNDTFQSMLHNGTTPTEDQLQEYGWVGSVLGLLNIVLKYLVQNYRILDNKNIEKIHHSSYIRINEDLVSSGASFSQISGEVFRQKKEVKFENRGLQQLCGVGQNKLSREIVESKSLEKDKCRQRMEVRKIEKQQAQIDHTIKQ